ncbi:hypothetical protein BLNAU_11916 [Blattamonas nauphoetae]|uniref:Uncharacterized protein n=1 Tax=Blattamonas nauphoetae TaxID=2049346 RepID=A0ABQ9XPJ9_9EUKA|nr:hypothetical protein BLNAU_11916 [Blattamonas nauphoetae]
MVQSGVEVRIYPHSKGSIPHPLVPVVTGQAGKLSTMLTLCGVLDPMFSVNELVTRQAQVLQTPRTVKPFLDILADFLVECEHRSLLQDITFLAQMQDRSSFELKNLLLLMRDRDSFGSANKLNLSLWQSLQTGTATRLDLIHTAKRRLTNEDKTIL